MKDEKTVTTNLLQQNTSDFYEWELEKIGQLGYMLHAKYSRKPRTEHWVQEFEKEAHEVFHNAGFLVHVGFDQENNLPTVEPLMRISGAVEHTQGFDHEKKQWELRRAKFRGEDWLGQKE